MPPAFTHLSAGGILAASAFANLVDDFYHPSPHEKTSGNLVEKVITVALLDG